MVYSKNSLNLKPKNKFNNTFKKSISSRQQVDGIVKKSARLVELKADKQKLNYIEVPVTKKQNEFLKNEVKVENLNKIEQIEIKESSSIDDTKRMFLKVAGVAGLGLAASALFPKSSEAYVSGSTPTSNVVGIKNVANTKINPATEDTLASIKAQSDLLTFDSATSPANLKVNIAAGEMGIKNTSDVAINPATEDTLALIKSQTDKFTFDGKNNLTAISGIKNSQDTRIDPAQDDSIILLRRIVKIMESQATVDVANRQRITLDALGAIGATMPVSGTVTATVSSAAITTLAGQNQQMYQDVARNTFANGIRNNLIWS